MATEAVCQEHTALGPADLELVQTSHCEHARLPSPQILGVCMLEHVRSSSQRDMSHFLLDDCASNHTVFYPLLPAATESRTQAGGNVECSWTRRGCRQEPA